jgi:DNA-binding MarR family transcriptional regulator
MPEITQTSTAELTEPTAELTEHAARLRLAINRMARRLRQQASADLGPASVAALATIERSGPLTPSELARIETIQRPTATRILSRLTEDGLVTRASDPADGRSSIVAITKEGRAALTRLRKLKTAYLAKELRKLSEEDVATLGRAAEILEQMLEGGRD